MPLLQTGNAYNGAKLNVRQTSTMPRSPAVMRYSPSRDNSIHCANKLSLINMFSILKKKVLELLRTKFAHSRKFHNPLKYLE